MINTVSVADEVWIATALLHREHPERGDFDKQEILERARREALVQPLRPGVSTHISSHAVAGKKPQPNPYRLLTETGRGRRRLFRDGDTVHTGRTGRSMPEAQKIPSRYRSLLTWYEEWRRPKQGTPKRLDPLLALAGSGAGIWKEDAVRYIKTMRGSS